MNSKSLCTSRLLTNNSKRSVKPGFDLCHFANGLMTSGWLIMNVGFMHVSSRKCPTSCNQFKFKNNKCTIFLNVAFDSVKNHNYQWKREITIHMLNLASDFYLFIFLKSVYCMYLNVQSLCVLCLMIKG